MKKISNKNLIKKKEERKKGPNKKEPDNGIVYIVVRPCVGGRILYICTYWCVHVCAQV
jgi:prolipoprotein diacylglyceryltransferase